MISAFVIVMSGAWMWKRRPFDAGLRRELGHRLEGAQVLGPAVGIARIVERVDADDDVGTPSASAHASASDRKTVLRAGT